MDKDKLITFPGKKKNTPEKDDYVFLCKCFFDIAKGRSEEHVGEFDPIVIPDSSFHILEDGYECTSCKRRYTIEQVHGSI